MSTQRQTTAVAVAGPAGVTERTFAHHGAAASARLAWFTDGLARMMSEAGYDARPEPGPDVQVVLHVVDLARPRPYRRRNAPTFVVAIAEVDQPPDDLLRTGYPVLVRGLANLAVLVSTNDTERAAHFVTLEQGTSTVRHTGSDDAFFGEVFGRVEPLASSRLVIANDIRPDLPPELWGGDDQTRQLEQGGERLDRLNLLPAPFPIEELLSERDLRHVKLLYGIGGLSYGNLSARRQPPTTSEYGPEFWMSASGVDKATLHRVGRDVLLVRGYDPERDAMVLSVPPDMEPNRVSVDAIEHWMIYREHPEVGAIVHVHAWIDGTVATDISYPCGTLELADAVAGLVRAAPDAARAIVGQRNHGLTITGPDLDDIFERIEGRVVPHVPMD
ncbi:MAG TPA: class II aldolase/adducin family protein [Acidimicrobiia bacterium]|nr:class II aldolase/adducin family protein [Acidimicrobiia bacterium]